MEDPGEPILERQRRWAREQGLAIEGARVRDLADNFFLGAPHEHALADFAHAGLAGAPLDDALARVDAHLALLCNVFDPFRDRPLAPLARALGGDPKLEGLSFLAPLDALAAPGGSALRCDVLLEGDGATPTAVISTLGGDGSDERLAALAARAEAAAPLHVVQLYLCGGEPPAAAPRLARAVPIARLAYLDFFEALRAEAPEMHAHQRYLRARYFRPRMGPTERQRLADANAFAAALHGEQWRKGTGIPYLSHVWQVAALVLEHGGNVDEAIAGLLHDSIEDAGVSHEEIAARFGPGVAGIVSDCTDLLPGDAPDRKAPWELRKRRYLAHLARAAGPTRLVAACDKLHNLRCLVADLRQEGIGTLRRFNATEEQTLWYHRQVWQALGDALPLRLRREAQELLVELEAMIEG